jgi:hypothetical protein
MTSSYLQELGYDFNHDPIEYALGLIDESILSERQLALMCLKFMSHDDIRQMLDDSELSPRFL